MLHDLDPHRLDDFVRRIAAHPRRRMDRERLWAAFAAAFPGRPQGPDERRWFLAALEELAVRQVIRLPSPRGPRWDRSMGVPVPTSVDLVREPPARSSKPWRAFPWHPRLQWVADLRHVPPEHERFLRRVHEGLVTGAFAKRAPLKYRSLQLTGDEKKLGRLMGTRLFGPGRLDAELLGYLPDVPPLAWESVSDRPTLIVFENAGPFAVAREVLTHMEDPPYGLVGYGGGAGFELSIRHLGTIDRRLERIDYVGDLDRTGLSIARAARLAAQQAGLAEVRPAAGLHQAMLEASCGFGSPLGWPHRSARAGRSGDDDALVAFLPSDVRADALRVLRAGRRIPEEVLGPDELTAVWSRTS